MADIFFDYDGTLHQSMLTYAPAFRSTMQWLSDRGYIPARSYSDSEISRWLGFNSNDMWSQFHPELAPEIREQARIRLGEDMARRIGNGEGALFPGTEDVLMKLKSEGHRLCFLSNCRRAYMERHTRVFGLERFFDFFFCCEDYDFIPKHEIFLKVAPKLRGPFVIIGDRSHDIEIAVKNGLPSIGCAYGYGVRGELSGADIIVSDICDIPAAVTVLLAERK